MNRYRDNWSAMGYSEQTEPSQAEIRRKQNAKILEKMINQDGFDEIVSLFRKIYKEIQDEDNIARTPRS